MNYASCNGSPQQIPLRQLPFANEAKPHYHCRAFWAQTGQEKFWGNHNRNPIRDDISYWDISPNQVEKRSYAIAYRPGKNTI